MSEDIKSKYVKEDTVYSFGWSHGKETLEPGQFDQHKGSYYNNPQYDEPTKDPELIKKYPKSLSPNVWPDEELPDFGRLFKKCGQLMVEVGMLVAHQCDKYGLFVPPSLTFPV